MNARRPWRIEVAVRAKNPNWIYISSAESEAGARKACVSYRHWWPAVRIVNRDAPEVIEL